MSSAGSSDQSDLRAQLTEASSEDSDLETDDQQIHIPLPFAPTSQDTITSTISGSSCPRDVPSPIARPPEKAPINKRYLCLLTLSHSLAFILGLYIGGRYLLSRRI